VTFGFPLSKRILSAETIRGNTVYIFIPHFKPKYLTYAFSLSPCPIQVERQTSPSSEIAVQTSAAAAPLSPYFTTAATVATSANIASDGKIFYGPVTGPFGAAGRLMESSCANSGNSGTAAALASAINTTGRPTTKEALTKRYDPEQLQRCLSDACLDWFTGSGSTAAAAAASPNSTTTRPLGYPFNRLKRTRSPSPPCLDSSYNADSGMCDVTNSSLLDTH
jgi:hypothetical protein